MHTFLGFISGAPVNLFEDATQAAARRANFISCKNTGDSNNNSDRTSVSVRMKTKKKKKTKR